MVNWNFFRMIFGSNKDLPKLSLSSLVTQLIFGFFWIFLARLLSVDNYGEIGFFVAIGTIASTISLIGGTQCLMVFPAKGIKIQGIVILSILVSIIASVIVAFAYDITVSIFIIGNVIFTLISSELLGLKLYHKFSRNILLQRCLSVVLAILLYYLLGHHGIILGLGLSNFIFIPRIIQIFRTHEINYSLLKSKKQFIISSYGSDLSKILASQLDKIIILPIFGATILGQYYLGMQIIAIGIALPAAVFQYLLPKESSGEQVKKTKIMNIILVVIIVIFGIILTPHLVPLLFPNFIDSVLMIQIMIIALIPLTVNLMYNSTFYAKENTKVILLGSAISISIQIPLILTLGRMWGELGLAISLVLAYTGESIYLFSLTKFSKINPSEKR